MNRRSFLIHTCSSLAAAALPVAGYAKWIEPVDLQVTHHRCRLPGLIANQPIRLLHISDLHASLDVPNSLIESAMGLAIDLKPDLVCITGDFITHRGGWNADWYGRTLRRLGDRLPVYATMGNHDGGWSPSGLPDSHIVRNVVQQAGFEVLHNRSVTMTAAGQQLELIGFGDVWGQEFRPGHAFPRTGAKLHPRILLSHNPDTKDRLADREWDLMLSGHTHGGQIVIPIVGSPWAPVRDMRYLHGLAPWGKRQIHVTSGVGSAHGVRFNCRPELALIELTGTTPT